MIFTNELLDLQERIESAFDIFSGNGYLLIRKGFEQELQGIVDTVPNYFYIDFIDGDGQLEFERMDSGTKGTHRATGNFKIVARTTGYTLDSVLENLLAILFDFNSEVRAVTTDEQFIYATEIGEELPAQMDLYLIEFSLTKFIMPKLNCNPIACKEC